MKENKSAQTRWKVQQLISIIGVLKFNLGGSRESRRKRKRIPKSIEFYLYIIFQCWLICSTKTNSDT